MCRRWRICDSNHVHGWGQVRMCFAGCVRDGMQHSMPQRTADASIICLRCDAHREEQVDGVATLRKGVYSGDANVHVKKGCGMASVQRQAGRGGHRTQVYEVGKQCVFM